MLIYTFDSNFAKCDGNTDSPTTYFFHVTIYQTFFQLIHADLQFLQYSECIIFKWVTLPRI